MLNIALDGLSVILMYKEAVAIFFVAGMGLGSFTLEQIRMNKQSNAIKLLSSLPVGLLFLSTAAFILALLFSRWTSLYRIASFVIFLFALFSLIKNAATGLIVSRSNYPGFIAGIVVLLSLLMIRMPFLRGMILPPYSDSSIHYQIINEILDPKTNIQTNLSVRNIFENYYHLGFHTLSAWLTTVSRGDPASTISLIGQLALVVAPLSVAALSYVYTKNSYGALFAGMLAAIGWSMPAFAVNWGKFPALVSLALFPAFFAYLSLYEMGDYQKPKNILLSLFLLFGAVVIHTRIIICIALTLVSIFLASKLKINEKPSFTYALAIVLLYGITLWPLSGYLVSYYSRFPLGVFFLFLLPFAFQSYPKLSAGIFFYTFGAWAVTKIPEMLFHLPGLLNDQFTSMMLYIPFSILGGAGLSGLINKFSKYALVVVAFYTGCVLYNFQLNASIYPDACCNYFQEDDRLMFDWIKENTSDDSLFVISTFSDDTRPYETDAGTWLYSLTERNTNKLPFNTNWDSVDIIREICMSNSANIYIYAGGGNFGFSKKQLSQSDWFNSVQKIGKVEVFKVAGCTTQ